VASPGKDKNRSINVNTLSLAGRATNLAVASLLSLLLSPVSTPAQDAAPSYLLIRNATLWDGRSDTATAGMSVLVEDNLIKQISSGPIAVDRSANTTVIDANGRTLMPGLIDMHTHLMQRYGVGWMREADAQGMGAAAKEVMDRYMAMGYTTLRDVGGNSLGIAKEVLEGRVSGPRLYSSGGAISAISGHYDVALFTEDPHDNIFVERGDAMIITGPIEAREATRRLFRGGASQIKIMVGGGVASNFDPLESTTMAEDEIRAVVEAAADFGSYVCAHAYTDESVNRVLNAGGRCIEHGFLVSEETVKRMKSLGAVMSLQTYAAVEVFKEPEKLAGFNAENVRKARQVRDGARNMLNLVAKYDVDTFYGGDLWQDHLIEEAPKDMVLRREWFSDFEILRQNTSSAGRWLAKSGTKNPYREGPIGVIEVGAYADMIVVEGNPLEDVTVLGDYDNAIKLIVKDGEIYKNDL